MATVSEKTIDIEKVLKDKMGAKAKFVPGFLVRWLKRIVHQDEINAFLWENRDKTGVEWLEACVSYLDIKLEIEGKENLPAADDKRLYTLVSNHPLGGADAGLEVAWLARRYKDNVIVPANNFLLHIKQLHHYLIPVNKLGNAQSRELAVLLDQAFRSDRQVLYFPAGACSRKIDGQIMDLEWKKTFITKSCETQRDVIPVWFSGHNSKRFYRIAAFRKFFKIKLNLEMLTLPDELFRYKGQHFKMVIGKPIPWQTFTPERTDTQWAQFVREQVYALKQD